MVWIIRWTLCFVRAVQGRKDGQRPRRVWEGQPAPGPGCRSGGAKADVGPSPFKARDTVP